jgi:hypothetical protein
MTPPPEQRTSIGLGANEVIIIDKPPIEIVKLLTQARADGVMLEIKPQNGDSIWVNPQQVKVVQSAGSRS